jgi:hypothetical protein
MRAPKKNVISLKVVFGLWEMFACHAVKFKHICSNFDCHAADSQDGHRYLPVLVLFLFPVSQAWFPHAYTNRHCYSSSPPLADCALFGFAKVCKFIPLAPSQSCKLASRN